MSFFDLTLYILKFFIPSAFSMMFRAFALGSRSRRRVILGFSAFTGYLFVVPALLISMVGYEQYRYIAATVMSLSGLSVLIFSTDPPGKTIFLQLVQANMVIAVSALPNLFRHLLGLSDPALVVLLIFLCTIVYLFALRFWVKPLRFIAENIHGNLTSLLILPIITMSIAYTLPVYPAQNFYAHPIYCTVMISVVELGFFLYLYSFHRNLRQISLLTKQELKVELLKAEILSYQDDLLTAKQNRHDLRHHDALILEYLQSGDIQGATDYLCTHSEALATSTLKQFCSNPTANAVLRIYERRTQAQGISFSVAAEFPETLPLTLSELGGLLGNLLENALDACERSEGIDRRIVFSAVADGDHLLLELRNTVTCQTVFRDGMPLSRKSNGGTGTKSITATVKKYGGMTDFSQQGTVFFTRIILPLKR